MFFNFDDEAFGPEIARFLQERFPKRSKYEKKNKRSASCRFKRPSSAPSGIATPIRHELLCSHQTNLDQQTAQIERIYVFDNHDAPPPGLRGMSVVVSERT